MSGWIKLHRSTLEWEWYTDANTFRVFMHLLLRANLEPTRYRGIEVPAGSVVVGRQALAAQLGMSEQSVRTALDHLGRSEITINSTNQFSVISIKKWSDYQTSQPTDNQPLTNDQPTINQRSTTSKESKNKEVIIRPEDVNEDLWKDFCALRKKKKATISDLVIKGIRKEADLAGWTIEQAMTEMVTRGWTGFKSSWVNKPEYRPATPYLSKAEQRGQEMREATAQAVFNLERNKS